MEGKQNSNSNMMAAIAWFLAPITSIVFIVLNDYKKDKYVQFHAWESLAFGAISFVVGWALSFTCIVPLALLVVQIVGVIKAYQGETWKLPGIGDWAEQQADAAAKNSK